MSSRRSSRVCVVAVVALAASLATAVPASAAGSVGRPTITKVAPATGPTSGGTHVRLVGTNFKNVRRVSFGSTSAAVFAISGTGRSMTVTAPASSARRTVDITLKTASGTVTRTNAFRYTAGWTAGWHAPSTIAPPVDSAEVLSCPSSHCYGMDRYGNFLDSGAGTGDWTNRGRPGGEPVPEAQSACPDMGNTCASLSCPEVGYCVTIDDQGRPLTWSGDTSDTWNAAPTLNVPGAHSFDHTPFISCASRTFCMAQDIAGDYSSFDGTSWSPVKALDGTPLTSAAQVKQLVQYSPDEAALSCAGEECMIVIGDGAYHYAAGSWTGSSDRWTGRDGDTGVYAADVSCANLATTGTALLCAAALSTGVAVFKNGRWGSVDYGRGVGVVGCSASGRCLGMGSYDNGATEYGDASATNDSHGWSNADPMPAGYSHANTLVGTLAVACDAGSTCRASVENGFTATYDLTARTWSPLTTFLARDAGITALGCSVANAQRHCLAGTDGPDLVEGTGDTWADPVEVFDRGERTAAVSCVAGTAFCMALANNNHFASKANHYAVFGNGTLTKHSMISGTYRALSCWSASGCYAVSATRVLRWNGSVWSAVVNLKTRHLDVVDIDCVAGNEACLAVTSDDRSVWVNGTQTNLEVSMNAPQEYVTPVGVACQSVHQCIAITNPDPVPLLRRAGIYSDTRLDWLPQRPLSATRVRYYRPGGVSCAPSATVVRCFAVGQDDNSMWDGAAHEVRPPDPGKTYYTAHTAVTCPSTTACYVGDADGRVLEYS